MSPLSPASVKVKVLGKIPTSERTDLNDFRNEYHFRTPLLSDRLSVALKDQRDEPMLHLILNIVEYVAPGSLLVYAVNLLGCSALVRHVTGIAYIALLVPLFLDRFILMMHYSAHRSIFHNELMNEVVVWLFAPFFGVPCGCYRLHHCIMHHIENNHELDISSTEQYQRDSWPDFARYWFGFVVLIWVELPLYCMKSKRWEWLGKLVSGLVTYAGFLYLMATCVSFTATAYVFLVTYVFTMSAMAWGNWCQHVFVNPENSHSNYQLTFNCIDTPANKRCFNDGYHVIHHVNARLHWSELPEYFQKHQDKHDDNSALTFHGIDFFEAGVLVMTKQLPKLAEYYVHLGTEETAPTKGQIVERMQSWLKPVPAGVQNVSGKAE
eukprot:gb/GFBE01040189.1/.p1 GENE.gb/GFBE01040189.1/~~gb/GFBE01040189.1/.p1  ORF type:complete len:380 (+),score=71.05 gb/GFBE01040189.1/:1-1140(+)